MSVNQTIYFLIFFTDGIKSNTKEVLISRKKKNAKNKSSDTPQINDIITVKMLFKRYIYDSEKLMKQ